jgi:hypothetical protein
MATLQFPNSDKLSDFAKSPGFRGWPKAPGLGSSPSNLLNVANQGGTSPSPFTKSFFKQYIVRPSVVQGMEELSNRSSVNNGGSGHSEKRQENNYNL